MMLKLSGYSEEYRRNTLSGVLKRWDTVVAEINDGTRKFHRNRSEIQLQKSTRGGNCPANWFLKGTVTATLSVPISHDSKLKRNIQKSLKSTKGPDGGSTLVIEQAGTRLAHAIPQPSNSTGCPYPDQCLVDPDKRCGGSKLVYKAVCQDCPEQNGSRPQYIGTSGHTLHSRSSTHAKDIRGSKAANSLFKHNKKFHQDSAKETDRFKFQPVSSHPKNTDRLITEAYWIQHSTNVINSKQEYGHGKWISCNFTSQAS